MTFASLGRVARPAFIVVTSVVTSVVALVVASVALGAGAAGCADRSSPPAARTATVTGKVLDSAARPPGDPLSGAVVDLTADPPDGRVPLASVKTSSSGTFRMERVPLGKYRVRARSAAHLEAWAPIEVTGTGAAPVELRLARTVVLAGHIEDARGARVPLAQVLAFAVAEASAPVMHQTQADDRGQFRLSGLGPGAHRLVIEAPGLGAATAGPLTAPDETVVVVMPGESRAIVGQVTRADLPVAGARVLLGGEGLTEVRSATTDAQGRFAFGGLGPGSYALRAEAGGFVGPVMTHVLVDRAQAEARKVALVLGPGDFVRGRVLGQDGHPVGGATVQIDLVPATGLWAAVLTDARGDWTSSPLAPGTYRIRGRHPGFVARRTVTVDIEPHQASSSVTPPPMILELIATGVISGRVVDGRGAPIAGATVRDRLAETEELGVIWSPLPLAAAAASMPAGAALGAALSDGPGGARSVNTDVTGRFALGEVPPGRLRVEVVHPSSIPFRTAPLTLLPGATLDIGTLRVEGAIQVLGRVLDAGGAPLGGVRVRATPTTISGTPADSDAGLYAITDDSGGFSLPLSAGDHQLKASAPGHTDVLITIHVQATAPPTTTPVTLRFANDGQRTVEGHVRDSQGRPLGRAEITATVITDSAPGPTGGDAPGFVASGVTDVGGHFRLAGLPNRPLQLEVRHAAYATHRKALASGGTDVPVIIEVPVSGAIDGEVHEKVTGAPVPGFEIVATGPDGATARYPEQKARRSRKDAAVGALRFALRRLAPGPWNLLVRAPRYHDIQMTVEVPSAHAPGEPSVRDLRLELERQ